MKKEEQIIDQMDFRQFSVITYVIPLQKGVLNEQEPKTSSHNNGKF